MKYLLDTNICIELLRGNQFVAKAIRDVGIQSCHISEITIAELLYGAELSNRKEENYAHVFKLANRINTIPIKDALSTYAIEKARLKRAGTPIDDFDLLIGSTAIAHNLIAVTDNVKHFNRLPITIENWTK